MERVRTGGQGRPPGGSDLKNQKEPCDNPGKHSQQREQVHKGPGAGLQEVRQGRVGDKLDGDQDLWVPVKGFLVTGEHKLTCEDLFSGKWIRGKKYWRKETTGQWMQPSGERRQ